MIPIFTNKHYSMKPISTKIHGFLDYATGLLLVLLPFFLNFDISDPKGMILLVLGAFTILLALITRYELGLVKLIPMPVHLVFDILSAVLLGASPWFLGFAGETYILYVGIALFEMVVIVLSQNRTGERTV